MKVAIIVLLFLFQGWIYSDAEYSPHTGDIFFQSLEHSPLVDAIEGGSNSPYSHCGILTQKNDKWYILEAIGPVKETPIKDWIQQARDDKFYAYRLKEAYQDQIDTFIESAYEYMGKPYDVRYRMDDEKIYCSELIYKAFKQATGEELGELKKLGDLNWKPYTSTIIYYEGGPPPLDREMITPRHLSEAEQLEFVFESGVEVNKTRLREVDFTIGPASFRKGDFIKIEKIEASSPKFDVGDEVIVRGVYKLGSRAEATISIFVTQTMGDGKSKILPGQQMRVTSGEEKFELKIKVRHKGYLHVSFYPAKKGQGFGGVYFGTQEQMKEISDWDPSYHLKDQE